MTGARCCVTGAGSVRVVERLARAAVTDSSTMGTSGSFGSWCRPNSGGPRFTTVSNTKIGCGSRRESRVFNGFAFGEVREARRQLGRWNCQTLCDVITAGSAFAGSRLCRCLHRVLCRGRQAPIATSQMALLNSSCSYWSYWLVSRIYRTKRAPLMSAR